MPSHRPFLKTQYPPSPNATSLPPLGGYSLLSIPDCKQGDAVFRVQHPHFAYKARILV